jgi:voltage-gated potassium channel
MDQEMSARASKPWTGMVRRLRELYEGDTHEAHQFRYALLVFDVTTILFIVVSSFLPRFQALEWFDVIIGCVVLADFIARLVISRNRWKDFIHPATLADVAAIISFLAPVVGEGIGFLRILRTLRLLHTYQLLTRLRQDSIFFRRNEELIIASVNLGVFIFVMTGFVFETQRWTNTKIGNYIDALYFTIAALTTTGFGDITLTGTWGHLLSVVIMICGVTLFLRLVQVLLRPNKVRFACPACALQRHDRDAVHCKACGTILNIPDEGAI